MKARTERADYAPRLKEQPPGGCGWTIFLEPRREDLLVLKDGFLCLELRPDVSREEAEEIASRLSETMECLSHTKFL